MKEKVYSDKTFWSKLWKLAAPIAFQNLMFAAVAAADALMLGRVTQDSMSAVSLATQIQFIQNMTLTSVVSTIVILGAQYWGKNDRKSVNDIFCIGLRSSVVVSMIFFIGCVFFPRYLMLIFTNEEVLIKIGIRYLKVAGWSYLLAGISQCYPETSGNVHFLCWEQACSGELDLLRIQRLWGIWEPMRPQQIPSLL